MTDSNDYQPLASYGPQTDLAVRETFFHASVSSDQLRDASRDISSSSAWPGFQFLLLMHDGEQARALSFWNNRRVLDNFIERHQAPNIQYVASQDADSPWAHDVRTRRIGQVDVHLADASMPAFDGDMVIWSPPGVVRICEIENVTQPDELRDWWPSVASPTSPYSLSEVEGLHFFSAVRYPDDRYTTYLGFRGQVELDRYLQSDLHDLHHARVRTEEFRRTHQITLRTGRLIAWFQRRSR